MSKFMFIATRKLTPDWFDMWTFRLFFFAACPLLFLFGVRAIARHATSPAEITIGLLSAASASLLFIVIGVIAPFAVPQWQRNLTAAVSPKSPTATHIFGNEWPTEPGASADGGRESSSS